MSYHKKSSQLPAAPQNIQACLQSINKNILKSDYLKNSQKS